MKMKCSSTPQKAPKSNRLFHSPDSQTLVSSTKLFSVPAICSNTAEPFLTDKYHFIFSLEGRSQQAVLEKTFLTKLKKDNVRITWEEAVMDLRTRACEVKIDITDLGAVSFNGDWMVFGLYFYSNNALINHPASKSSLKFDRSGQVFDDDLISKREEWDECRMVKMEEKSFCDVGKQEEFVNFLEEDSSHFIAPESSSHICHVEHTKPVDESLNVSMIVHPDLSHHDREDNNERIELFREVVYADSLIWRSSFGNDDDAVDVKFEEALASNGVLENLGNLADAFDELYDEYFTKNHENPMPLRYDDDEMQMQNSSWVSPTSTKTKKYEINNSALSSPSLASTPAPKSDLEFAIDISSSSLSECDVKVELVKKDSGYFESFSSGDLTVESATIANSEVTRTGEVSHNTRNLFFKQLFGFSVNLLISELKSVIF